MEKNSILCFLKNLGTKGLEALVHVPSSRNLVKYSDMLEQMFKTNNAYFTSTRFAIRKAVSIHTLNAFILITTKTS